jgi:hypothetical protein
MKTLHMLAIGSNVRAGRVGAVVAMGVAAAAAFGQNGMPLGTRQWIELSANSIAPCTCVDDKIGFVAAMPSPSPNYVRDPAGLALGRVLTAEAASTATSLRGKYTRNYFDNIFLRNSFVDTYTITGPAGSNGQSVAATVTMTAVGELRVPMSSATAAIGTSVMILEIGTWNPNAATEQFRVNPVAGGSLSRSIPFANHGPAPVTLAINETLTTPFTRVVGTPFDVAFGYDLQGSAADVASTIVWNLPPGFSITSVLGYTAPGSGCDSIDFNNNGVFPEDQDAIDFFDVLAGGECAACNDVDFNNNGVFPEDQDVVDFFNVLAGGECP